MSEQVGPFQNTEDTNFDIVIGRNGRKVWSRLDPFFALRVMKDEDYDRMGKIIALSLDSLFAWECGERGHGEIDRLGQCGVCNQVVGVRE